MKPGLIAGMSQEVRFEVTQAMCPHFDGVLVHPVCATWTLANYMEVAGRKLLTPHLEPHEEGVGVHLTIDHRAAAPIGALVTVRATVESASARRLTCVTHAASGERTIAEGRFVQAILPKERLAEVFASGKT
ncbi:MAG: thioesterase [Planctomycetota bacterium]|nr:MAG: thioesterase [Planctomycetota bacterium]